MATTIDDVNPIRYLRKRAGLTQVQLANLAEVTEQYVRRCEKGMISSTDETLLALWGACEVTINNAEKYDFGAVCGSLEMDLLQLAVNTDLMLPLPFEISGEHTPQTLYDAWAMIKRNQFRGFIEHWYMQQTHKMYVVNPKAFRSRFGKEVLGSQRGFTIYALSEMLCLHPFIIENFEKQYTGGEPIVRWPQEYRQALSQAGFSTDWVVFTNGADS